MSLSTLATNRLRQSLSMARPFLRPSMSIKSMASTPVFLPSSISALMSPLDVTPLSMMTRRGYPPSSSTETASLPTSTTRRMRSVSSTMRSTASRPTSPMILMAMQLGFAIPRATSSDTPMTILVTSRRRASSLSAWPWAMTTSTSASTTTTPLPAI